MQLYGSFVLLSYGKWKWLWTAMAKEFVTVCCSGIEYLPNDHRLWTAVDSRNRALQFTNFPQVVCRLTKSYILAGHRAQTL